MSFWIGFAESFKPAKLAEMYVEIAERRRKEALEEAKRVEEKRQAELFGQSVLKNLEYAQQQFGIDTTVQRSIIADMIKSSPDYQTLASTAQITQSFLGKQIEQQEELRKEKLRAEKDALPKLEGHYFDENNRVVGIFKEKDNYYVAHITDQNGNYVQRKDADAGGRAERKVEEIKDIINYGVGLMGAWSTSSVEVNAPAFAKFLEKKEVFLATPEGKSLLNNDLTRKIAEDIIREKENNKRRNIRVSAMINRIRENLPNASHQERAKMLMAVASLLQRTESFSIE